MAHDSSGVADSRDPLGPADRPERVRESHWSDPVDAPIAPGVEPYQRRLDRPDTRAGDTPREAIRGFAPDRANLEPITGSESEQYVRENVSDRPWLNHAQYVGPDTCRVLAAVDKGGGHLLERHGSTVTPERLEARASRLEDPAIVDDAARTPGRDAFKSGRHFCGDVATRITDPHALATCFARGVEHPEVRAVLDRPYDLADQPARPVEIPLSDLLGADGHKYCDGYRLDPVNGSMDDASQQRKAWVDAIRHGDQPDVPEPTASRMSPDDFRDAVVVFGFRPDNTKTSWEISTMHVDPVETQET